MTNKAKTSNNHCKEFGANTTVCYTTESNSVKESTQQPSPRNNFHHLIAIYNTFVSWFLKSVITKFS